MIEDRLLIQGELSNERIERKSGQIYLRTQFLYQHPENKLVLLVWDETRSFHLDKVLNLDTNDKIALLAAINKDNNRIKNMMEENKTKEYTPKEVDCDRITSKEKGDGIEWTYYKDGKSTGTAFMTYKKLYEIQIEPSTNCKFCNEPKARKYVPQEGERALYLCEQHEKYIQRISQRINGIVDEV